MMLIPAQTDRFLQRPRAIRVEGDARLGKALGQRLPEDKLPSENSIVQAHGVGRTVVREAISKLQASGLVETRHRIGTFVIERTPE